jgi:prepilin-type processing-associated H-X9-DG protein
MLIKRSAFTLFQLLVVLAVLALLFVLIAPLITKLRIRAAQAESASRLHQLSLACHNYHDVNRHLPPGLDDKGFSAAAYLLPYIEQEAVYKEIDFKKSIDAEANKKVAAIVIKTFLDPQDVAPPVDKDFGGTNYLFNAGSQYDLKDNDGVFYLDSKIKFTMIPDGLSNTMMIGQTLRGDGAAKATDVRRQFVRLKKDDLKKLSAGSGVRDFDDSKNIAADRGKSWMDGHFLQGTFTGTLTVNSKEPDVDCHSAGGISAVRGIVHGSNVAMCDGSVRFVTDTISLATWQNAANRTDGNPLGSDWGA